MRLFLLFSLMLLLHYQGICGDYSSWHRATPGGNDICYESWDDEMILGIKCTKNFHTESERGFTVYDMTRFYFYNNHIVGEFREDSILYKFVFNEADCEMLIFADTTVYNRYLKETGLIPLLWTRWYDESWENPPLLQVWQMMVLWPLFGVLLIFSLIVLIASRFKVPAINWFFTIVFLLIVIKIFLNNHSGSF